MLHSNATDRGDTILFDIGLLLAKDDAFAAGVFPRNARYESRYSFIGWTPFCINPEGQVVAYLDDSYFNCDLLRLPLSECERRDAEYSP